MGQLYSHILQNGNMWFKVLNTNFVLVVQLQVAYISIVLLVLFVMFHAELQLSWFQRLVITLTLHSSISVLPIAMASHVLHMKTITYSHVLCAHSICT